MKGKAIISILIIIAIIIIVPIFFRPKDAVAPVKEAKVENEIVKDTYTYTNHGFSIELPKGFTPHEEQSEGGPAATISLPWENTGIIYVTDSGFWEKNNLIVGDGRSCTQNIEVIGNSDFQKCIDSTDGIFYWLKKGKVGYQLYGDKKYFLTFKFVGWPQVEGNKDDLVSFSIKPGQEVSGVMKVTGVLSGGYFFEGNLPISILDENKNLTSYGQSSGMATTDWMTAGPVSFSIDFDFNKIPKGNYYIQLMQDDPRDDSERGGYQVKKVLIPIVVK